MPAPSLNRIIQKNLLLWIFIPSLFFILMLGVYLASDEVERITKRNTLLAQSIAKYVDNYIEGAVLALQHLSLQAFSVTSDLDFMERDMHNVQYAYPQLERILWVDEQNKVLASAPPGSAGTAFPRWRNAVERGAHLIMKPAISPDSGRLIARIEYPVHSGGLIIGELNLDTLQEYMSGALPKEQGLLILADEYGNLIAHPNSLLVERQTNIGHHQSFQLASKGESEGLFFQEQDTTYLGAAAAVGETGWLLIVYNPIMEILGPALTPIVFLALGMVITSLSLVLILRRELFKRLAAPMTEFSHSIQNIAHGRYEEKPAGRDSFQELAALAVDVESMASRIRQREEELRASEEKYRNIFENAVEGLFQSTSEGRFLSANPATARMFGYDSAEELIDEIQDIGRDLYVNSVRRQELFEALRSGDSVSGFEVEMRRKDGEIIWIELHARGVYDQHGRLIVMEGILEDVTARKESQKMLLQSEERFRQLANAAWEAIMIHDNGVVLQANEQFFTMFGYSEEEVLGRQVLPMLIAPESLGFLQKQFQEMGLGPYEVTAMKKDGQEMTLEIRLRAIEFNGRSVGVGAIRDITERKRIEEELEQLNRGLEKLVQERTAELEQKAAELEQANKRLIELDAIKSNFLSSVSHELRTPLTSVLGFAKLIGKEFNDHFLPDAKDSKLQKKGERIKDNLDIIVNEGRRLTRLINDVLDLNKIESGRMVWEDDYVFPGDVVQEAARAVSGVFDSAPDLTLKVEVQEGLTPLFVDRDKLTQVLINLLNNAAKFTEAGEVLVRAYEEKLGLFRIDVSDTGVGIQGRELVKIFDKFHQSITQDTILEKPQGTGLGLAICKQIVTHYGGVIWAESQPGKGSCFSLRLPTLHTDDYKLTEADNIKNGVRHRPTILVVDDDPAVNSYLCQLLSYEGYRVASAYDGEEGLRQAEKIKPALITMDLMMPNMDGKTAIAHLKQDEQLAHIPVLVISILKEAEAAGGDATLIKPLNEELLIETVHGLLGKKHVQPSHLALQQEGVSEWRSLEQGTIEWCSKDEILRQLEKEPCGAVIVSAATPNFSEMTQEIISRGGHVLVLPEDDS